jgi:two-component system sensor histidine kinase YesM
MFKKNSITYKYMKASIFIVILPILVANVVLNKLYLDTLLGSYSDRILQNIEGISEELNSEIKADTSTALKTAKNSEIIELVNNWVKAENASYKIGLSEQINAKLDSITDIHSVVFLFKGKGMYCYPNRTLLSETEIREKSLFDSKEESVKVLNSLTGITGSVEGKYRNSIIVRPQISEIKNDIEAVYFSFNSIVLENINNIKLFGNSGQILITDSSGKVMFFQKKQIMLKVNREMNIFSESGIHGNDSGVLILDGKKVFATCFTIPDNGWRMYGLVDYMDLTKETGKILKFAIIFSVFIILLFLIFSVLFLRDMLIPVDKLTRKMKMVEKGYLDAAIEIKGNDEINNLGKSFNRMISEIKKLINERDIKEKEKEKAEIEALQSQINPHFISNTLNSIRLMAMIAKVDSIKNMTEAFMKLLTSTFSRKGIFNTLETELEVLKSYVYIMNVRFGDKFDVVFEIDENIRQCYVLKLVLQPILENAILHGISDIEEKGLIKVKGFGLNGDLVIEIIDNGKGMSDEEIKDLLSDGYRNTKGFNGMGLKNVDKRIKLNYGNRFGLQISSVFGEFTNVRVVLPQIMYEQGGTFDAKSNGS